MSTTVPVLLRRADCRKIDKIEIALPTGGVANSIATLMRVDRELQRWVHLIAGLRMADEWVVIRRCAWTEASPTVREVIARFPNREAAEMWMLNYDK
jgi:hypothetical protein